MKLKNSPSNQVRERKDNSMTRDDIMRMAREATMLYVPVADLEHFAALVAANEREACAKLCEEFDAENPYIGQSRACAFEIRARGNAE